MTQSAFVNVQWYSVPLPGRWTSWSYTNSLEEKAHQALQEAELLDDDKVLISAQVVRGLLRAINALSYSWDPLPESEKQLESTVQAMTKIEEPPLWKRLQNCTALPDRRKP